MPFSGNINLNITGALTTNLDLEAVVSNLNRKMLLALTDGSGANQATNCFSDTRVLAASATEALDLSGVLLNAFGQVITFARIKALMIFASAGNANDVLVGGAATNGFVTPFTGATHQNRVKPGGSLIITAPDAIGLLVTAATGDLLQITNGGAGTSVSYDVILIGA